MKRLVIFLWIVIAMTTLQADAQNTKKRVLFLGNSYTNRNDLPQIVSNIANSRGDTLIVDFYAPNSYTLLLHTRDANTLSIIATGNWDLVVLQEQSQRPALPSEADTRFFPNVKILDSLVNVFNPCGETMLYMTWGRKNGDVDNCGVHPPVCTYVGMDSLLRLAYMQAADNNKAVVSPVGAVWRHIRQNYPSIELYNVDETHPSVAGSYAAALCFYTCIFRKNPVLVNFNNGLTATEANNIKMAVKTVVFDSLLNWQIGTYDPKADFTRRVLANNTVAFTNRSTNATQYFWEFGDGNTSTVANPTYTYATSNTYTVKLKAIRCNETHTFTQSINVSTTGIQEEKTQLHIYPNPVSDKLVLENNPFDKLLIVNSMGQVKAVFYDNKFSTTIIDFSRFAVGHYLLVLVKVGRVLSQKLVKQ